MINKSMHAVDLIRKYKDDGSNKAATGANGANSTQPNAIEIEQIAEKIT